MDPMKPACDEPNIIETPSLKESLQKDIKVLDEYFETRKLLEMDKEEIQSWANVRESAISFADIFDKMESLQFKMGGDSDQ